MNTVRNPKDQASNRGEACAQPAGQPVDQPSTEARGAQGDLEIEFEMEIPEFGGEA